ncbi:GNAT family protein [Stenotrophomonas sp. MMGLT7]|uniref:GNAT family N-acetyltransferase n=1 Tax=Stenotrophomonas sp. MMGLT7 TaxID=2901227 RepID=UPI001E62C7A0|nr:GNAT family protein [Stenotrophomonas sp. MMGLT7]MCD7099682.1 GNAT family N-acetyltransferase [Stenotrophomonas sp. MMGLT7]
MNDHARELDMEAVRIEAGDVLLRPFRRQDAPAFAEAALESVASVGPWLPWCTGAYSERDALDWFANCREQWRQGSAREFGAFDRQTGALLGGAGLNQIAHDHRYCNLGYWVRQSRQGRGIAANCAGALAEYGFSVLGLQRVEIVVALDNLPSAAVAGRLGALREGVARNRLFLHGRPLDALVFSLVPQRPPTPPGRPGGAEHRLATAPAAASAPGPGSRS